MLAQAKRSVHTRLHLHGSRGGSPTPGRCLASVTTSTLSPNDMKIMVAMAQQQGRVEMLCGVVATAQEVQSKNNGPCHPVDDEGGESQNSA